MVTAKEIEAVKRKLKKAEQLDIQKRADEASLLRYRRRSDAGAAKTKSKAAKRDVFARGRRLPGAGYTGKS